MEHAGTRCRFAVIPFESGELRVIESDEFATGPEEVGFGSNFVVIQIHPFPCGQCEEFKMFRVFRLFALTAFAIFLSFPARADAPEGWTEDEKFALLGREAYQAEDGGLLALVDRMPIPNGSHEEWIKDYVKGKLTKYTVTDMQGPSAMSDDVTGPIEGGYIVNTTLKNEKGQVLIMTFGVLIREDAQVYQIFWNGKDLKSSPPFVVKALNFLANGGSVDPTPERTDDLNKILGTLNIDSKTLKKKKKSKDQKPKAAEPAPEPKPYVAEPGKGVRNKELRGVVYDFGKREMKKVWVNDMMMRIPKWSGSGVYLVFKDGWAYRSPSVPPADLNVAESRRVEPKRWVRWDDLKLSAPTAIMPPLEKGTLIDISVQRPNTSSSSRTSVRTSWRGLKLTAEGRFETDLTSISSRQTGIDSSMGPSSNTVSSSGKDGSFSSVSAGYVAGGGMIRTQGTSRKSGSKGNHSGTYFIDGNTIELRYDDGAITRVVFGYDGEDAIIFGRTNYWR